MAVSSLQSLSFQKLPLHERNMLLPEIQHEPQAELKTKGMRALTKKWRKSFKPVWQNRTYRSANRMTIPAIKRQLKSALIAEFEETGDPTYIPNIKDFLDRLLLFATKNPNNEWARNEGTWEVRYHELVERFVDIIKDDALKSFYDNWFETWDDLDDTRFINNPRYFKQTARRAPRAQDGIMPRRPGIPDPRFIVDGVVAGKKKARTKRNPTRRTRTQKKAVK